MRYIQIRVSTNSSLNSLLEEISKDVWLKTKKLLQTSENVEEYYFRLRKMITRAINRRVHKFPNCGLAQECHDEIEGAPWLNYDEKIYMLSLVDNFEGLMNDIAKRAVRSLPDELSKDRQSELYSVISTELRHKLGKHIYFNPACRLIPFCETQLNKSVCC